MKLYRIGLVALLAVSAPAAWAEESGKTPAKAKATTLILKDDAPEAVKRLVAGDQARKVEQIKRLETLITLLRSRISEVGKEDGGFNKQTQEAVKRILREEVTSREAEIQRLRDGAEPFYPPVSSSAEIRDGFIGKITRARVTRIIDQDNALICALTVREPVPENVDLDEIPMDETDIWLTNFKSSTLFGKMLSQYRAGNKYFDLDLPVHVEGTKVYSEPDAKDRKLPLAQPFSIERWLKPRQHGADPNAPATRPAGPAPKTALPAGR